MSFETIFIHTQIPVVNGYAQYLNNKPSDRTRVSEEDALDAILLGLWIEMGASGGPKTSSLHASNKKGNKFIRLPGRNPGSSYPVDPTSLL